MKTLFWYDLETFGADPKTARISQIAGIRTDLSLNVIGEPINVLVKLADDWLADPIACVITGLTPIQCNAQGIPEADALQHLLKEITQPETIVCGYNSSRFDDTVVSFSCYRNGLEPYPINVRNQNMRWDVIDVARMAYASSPHGIQWPTNDLGVTSFRLEDLATANGIRQDQAHDALWDVHATIDLAKRLSAAQPRLFEYLLAGAPESVLATRLGYSLKSKCFNSQPEPILWASGSSKGEHKRAFITLPLAPSPQSGKTIITWHLRQDPTILDQLDVQTINQCLFSSSEDLKQQGLCRIEAPALKLNKSPSFVPALPILERDGMEDWLNIELDQIYSHLELWGENQSKWLPKLIAALSIEPNYPIEPDVDLQLYDRFIVEQDKHELNQLHEMGWVKSAQLSPNFKDARLAKIWMRTKARNALHHLSEKAQQQWKTFVQRQLLSSTPDTRIGWHDFHSRCQEALQLRPNAQPTIDELHAYYQDLKQTYHLPAPKEGNPT